MPHPDLALPSATGLDQAIGSTFCKSSRIKMQVLVIHSCWSYLIASRMSLKFVLLLFCVERDIQTLTSCDNGHASCLGNCIKHCLLLISCLMPPYAPGYAFSETLPRWIDLRFVSHRLAYPVQCKHYRREMQKPFGADSFIHGRRHIMAFIIFVPRS